MLWGFVRTNCERHYDWESGWTKRILDNESLGSKGLWSAGGLEGFGNHLNVGLQLECLVDSLRQE